MSLIAVNMQALNTFETVFVNVFYVFILFCFGVFLGGGGLLGFFVVFLGGSGVFGGFFGGFF